MDSSKIKTGISRRRKIQDAELRERLRERFAMLEKLVEKVSERKMSQADILKATHKAAVKIKKNGPHCRGVYDGFGNIESLVILYIKSLFMNETAEASQIGKIRNFFELTKENFSSNSAKSADITRNQSSNLSFVGADAVEIKNIGRIKQQNRRDSQSDGFSLLRQFIDENSLCAHSPLHKTQILDVMINYLSEATTVTLPDSPVELKMYFEGFEHGKNEGKASVICFFETEPIFKDQILIYRLPVLFPDLFALPVLQMPSSTGSIASPSSLTDASATSSDRDSDSVPVPEEMENKSGIFRPWE